MCGMQNNIIINSIILVNFVIRFNTTKNWAKIDIAIRSIQFVKNNSISSGIANMICKLFSQSMPIAVSNSVIRMHYIYLSRIYINISAQRLLSFYKCDRLAIENNQYLFVPYVTLFN